MKIAPRLWGLKQEEQKSNQKNGCIFIGMKFYPLVFLSSVSSEPVPNNGWPENELSSSVSPEGKITILV